MGVRIDGDLDFQDWYYEKYNPVEAVVSKLLGVFFVISQIVLILYKIKSMI